MFPQLIASLLLGSTWAADCNVFVGKGGLRFEPASCSVKVGDNINFEFSSSGHNVVQGESERSCSALAGGFEFPANAARGSRASAGSKSSFKVTKTGPAYFYCDPHCRPGMRFKVDVVA